MKVGMLAVGKILVNDDNRPEGSGDDIDGLIESMDEFGMLLPLLVIPAGNGYAHLQAGHRRLRAALARGEEKVPVIIRDRTSLPRDVETLLITLVENGQRQALSPVESARHFSALVGKGVSPPQIAKRAGLHPSTVYRHLSLLRADKETLALVEAGKLTVTSVHRAITQIGKDGPIGQPVAVRRPRRTRRRPPPHFTASHPLAVPARELCTEAQHPATDRLGGVACGPCWEQAIRQDQDHASQAEAGEAGTRPRPLAMAASMS